MLLLLRLLQPQSATSSIPSSPYTSRVIESVFKRFFKRKNGLRGHCFEADKPNFEAEMWTTI